VTRTYGVRTASATNCACHPNAWTPHVQMHSQMYVGPTHARGVYHTAQDFSVQPNVVAMRIEQELTDSTVMSKRHGVLPAAALSGSASGTRKLCAFCSMAASINCFRCCSKFESSRTYHESRIIESIMRLDYGFCFALRSDLWSGGNRSAFDFACLNNHLFARFSVAYVRHTIYTVHTCLHAVVCRTGLMMTIQAWRRTG